MSILNDHKVYKVSEMIVSKKDAAGVNLLVSLDESNNFFRIDGVASQVWDQLKEGQTIAAITQKLIQEYPDNQEQILTDVEAFLKQLLELKVISG